MNFQAIFTGMSGFIKVHAPEILTVAGSAMVVGGVVASCAATKKITYDVKHAALQERLEAVRAIEDDKQRRKALCKSYAVVSTYYFKKYALGGALVIGGLGSLVCSNIILQNRNTALSTAYTALASTVATYRAKVKDVVGAEAESHMWNQEEPEKKTVTTVDDNGEFKEEEKDVFSRKNNTPFSRLFGEGYSDFWQKDGRTVLAHLQASEANLNAKLKERGTLSMNEVWHEIGFKNADTREGAILGWKYKKGDPEFGDTYIDLGFTEKADNQFRIDMLKHAWNQEVWVDVRPPHVLTRCLKKERVRTDEEKKTLLRNRKSIGEVDE